MKLRVTLAIDCEIPDDLEQRLQMYGTDDPAACAAVDLECDSASFMLDNPSTVLGTEVLEA